MHTMIHVFSVMPKICVTRTINARNPQIQYDLGSEVSKKRYTLGIVTYEALR